MSSSEDEEQSDLSVEEDEVDASSSESEDDEADASSSESEENDEFDEEEFERTRERIAANDPTLTRVNFDDQNIGDERAKRLITALQANTVLICLYLANNGISAALVMAFVGVLASSTTLEGLDLSGNTVCVEGARAVGRFIRNNSSLRVLNLSNCGIGAEGARLLAAALPSNSTLTFLNLKDNDIGDLGASALARSLPENSTLTTLHLERNEISDVGAIALVEALLSNTSLTMLLLGRNNITVAGARLLAEALLVNSSVTDIDLWGDDISAAFEQLVRGLTEINADASNPQEALGRKIEWLINLDKNGAQLLGFEERGAKEKAVSLALDNLDSFVEAEQRQELFGKLLGSSQHGETVANCVDVATARNLYLDAAQCGAAPEVLMNILRSHESLCSCRDVKHGLYPFMLLATMPEAGVGGVMELLIMNPDLVKGDTNRAS